MFPSTNTIISVPFPLFNRLLSMFCTVSTVFSRVLRLVTGNRLQMFIFEATLLATSTGILPTESTEIGRNLLLESDLIKSVQKYP